MSKRLLVLTGAAVAGAAYCGVATGAVTVDLNVGRRRRELGPLHVRIAASPDTVFDVIAGPYQRVPRAMAEKLEVVDRGAGYALAAHRTAVRGGLRTTTLELVRFERPHRITFRLLRGPVAAGFETFALQPDDAGTDFEYSGYLEADLWRLGARWLDIVGRRWESTVESTMESVRVEAERRAAAGLS